jgi:hypothetical protein
MYASYMCPHPQLLMRYVISKDMAVLMKPAYVTDTRSDISRTLLPLPQNAIARLDALEEGLYSAWDPKEDLGDDLLK